jgi:hypothetical protein
MSWFSWSWSVPSKVDIVAEIASRTTALASASGAIDPPHEHAVVSQIPTVQATPTSHCSPAPSSRIPSRHLDRFAVNRVLGVFFAFTVPVTTSQAASNAPVTRTLPLTPAHTTPTGTSNAP